MSSLAGDVKCYSSHFTGKKTSKLWYHPSFPAYGALSAGVSGSTWHFQAGLIPQLPSQVCARKTRGEAPQPWQLSWYRSVQKNSPCLSWLKTCKAAQKSPQNKNKCLSVAFRPRLALTRLGLTAAAWWDLRRTLESLWFRPEWSECKNLCKSVVLLIFFWVDSISVVLLCMFSQKGLPRAVADMLRKKWLFAL